MPVKGFVDFPHVGGAIDNHQPSFCGVTSSASVGDIDVVKRRQSLPEYLQPSPAPECLHTVDDQADFLFVALKLDQLCAGGVPSGTK